MKALPLKTTPLLPWDPADKKSLGAKPPSDRQDELKQISRDLKQQRVDNTNLVNHLAHAPMGGHATRTTGVTIGHRTPKYYKHQVPLRITIPGGQVMACTAMVDSGNVWTNVISKKLFQAMNFTEADLKPLNGPTAVGTAKAGAEMTVLGQLRRPLKLQIGNHDCKFKDQPVVLDGLAMDFNISGPFLRAHNINQLHSEDSLSIQGKRVPLLNAVYASIEANKVEIAPIVPPEEVNYNYIFLSEDKDIPPYSIALIQAHLPGVSSGRKPAGSHLVDGCADFMRKTDLHPWKQVLIDVDAEGNTVVGAMNTTPHTIRAHKYDRYGESQPTIDPARQPLYPWRICVIEPKSLFAKTAAKWVDADKAKSPRPGGKKADEDELPAWMKGPPSKENIRPGCIT